MSNTTPEHIRQLVAEDSEWVSERLVKLEAFFVDGRHNELHGIEQSLLRQQLEAMRTYSFALRARMFRWQQQDEAAQDAGNYGGTD